MIFRHKFVNGWMAILLSSNMVVFLSTRNITY